MDKIKGEWIFKKTEGEADVCDCSVCGGFARTVKGTRLNFCPHCGADMRLEESTVEHFLEVEIAVSERALCHSYTPYYDGVCVGNKKARELRKKHIMFCEHLLKLIKKEKSDNK